MKFTPEKLTNELAAIIDPFLARQVVNSYIEMMQRFYAGDWRPSELDGGQFCEAVARSLYQFDTGTILHDLPHRMVEQLKSRSISHNISWADRNHFCAIIMFSPPNRTNDMITGIDHSSNHSVQASTIDTQTSKNR